MKETITRCDRCTRQINGPTTGAGVLILIKGQSKIDICAQCVETLLNAGVEAGIFGADRLGIHPYPRMFATKSVEDLEPF